MLPDARFRDDIHAPITTVGALTVPLSGRIFGVYKR
jgi:hypothetical protein